MENCHFLIVRYNQKKKEKLQVTEISQKKWKKRDSNLDGCLFFSFCKFLKHFLWWNLGISCRLIPIILIEFKLLQYLSQMKLINWSPLFLISFFAFLDKLDCLFCSFLLFSEMSLSILHLLFFLTTFLFSANEAEQINMGKEEKGEKTSEWKKALKERRCPIHQKSQKKR